MSFYVEVMCDKGRMDNPRCRSFQSNNPQGRDLKGAAAQARREGWRVNGRSAVCPPCQREKESTT